MSKDEVLKRLREWAVSHRYTEKYCKVHSRTGSYQEDAFFNLDSIAKTHGNSAELLEEAAKLIENS